MVKEGSLIEKYFRFFEHHSYRQADMIGLMSEKNLEVFQQSNQGKYPTHILRNWAALKPHFPGDDTQSIRQRLELQDKVIYFYGGNIGHAQDMANLMRLAKGMQQYENAHFLFVGQGDEVELVQQLADEWNLSNFSYLPSVSQDEFKDLLSEIDVGLFSLAANHTAHNFPGKLLGYMVQSIPILGSVNEGNDLLELVNSHRAGYISINGKDDELLARAVDLYNSKQLRDSIGANAFALLKQEFSVSCVAQSIEHQLVQNR
jgi:glycosyltransferase involved in cell wall biosynthesis